MNRISLISATLGLLLLAPLGHAQSVLFSWENNAEGWALPDGGGSPFTEYTTSVGVTDGTYAAVRFVPTGFWNNIHSPESTDIRAALAGNNQLSVDVTGWNTYPDWIPGQNRKITLQIFIGDDLGIHHDIVIPGLPVTGSGVTDTHVWDYSAYQAAIASADPSNWAQIRLVTEFYSGLTPGNISFDRLTLIPEPSTVSACFGFVALTVVVYRRRKLQQ